jgi:DNA-binding response OmpR family regulator
MRGGTQTRSARRTSVFRATLVRPLNEDRTPAGIPALSELEMNRTTTSLRQGVAFGPFRLFVGERLLEKGGIPVALGSRALDILILLVERAGARRT